MAICTFGGGVTGIRGSIAGLTFSNSHSGPTIRRRQKPVFPRTDLQGKRNALLGVCAHYWRDELNGAERADWAILAAATNFENSLGELYHIQANALWIRAMAGLQLVGAAPDKTPPLTATEVVPNFVLIADNTPRIRVVAWANFSNNGGGFLAVYVSHAVPASQLHDPTHFRIGSPVPSALFLALPQTILEAPLIEAGQRYFVRGFMVRTVGNLNGRVGFETIVPIDVPA